MGSLLEDGRYLVSRHRQTPFKSFRMECQIDLAGPRFFDEPPDDFMTDALSRWFLEPSGPPPSRYLILTSPGETESAPNLTALVDNSPVGGPHDAFDGLDRSFERASLKRRRLRAIASVVKSWDTTMMPAIEPSASRTGDFVERRNQRLPASVQRLLADHRLAGLNDVPVDGIDLRGLRLIAESGPVGMPDG